jgi:hypothetical protein
MMEAENPRAVIGGNAPPDPIDVITAKHESTRMEVENWLDGKLVATEEQMLAVDKLLKAMKTAATELDAARDAETGPLHKAWKEEVARWKPTEKDYERLKTGLVKLVDDFKQKLAAEKEEKRIAAEKVAADLAEAARLLHLEANPADIEAVRAADAAIADAAKAKKVAVAAGRDTVKGLRTYTTRTVDDPLIFGRWVWANDKPAFEAFLQAYADKMTITPPAGCGATERKEQRAV